MKICAIICEFNPFHNGHAHLLGEAARLSGCDFTLCIMSGDFTQRGDLTVMDKYDRARHAVLAGADCVLELPAAFTVSPAEIFAKGAISILKTIPAVKFLSFGCETPNADFFALAREISEENAEFKRVFRENLKSGMGYVKSRAEAFGAAGGDAACASLPNNILGIEYAAAIKNSGADIKIVPVKRLGSGFSDTELGGEFSSSAAIRKNFADPSVKKALPPYVYKDLTDFSAEQKLYGELLRFCLLNAKNENLKGIFGCSEGIENALKNNVGLDCENLVLKAAGKRYTLSRVKRILLSNMLSLTEKDCKTFLNAPLYLKPLAIKSERADEILKALSLSSLPLLMKERDVEKLTKTAQKCLDLDVKAHKIRNFIFKKEIKDFYYPQFV